VTNEMSHFQIYFPNIKYTKYTMRKLNLFCRPTLPRRYVLSIVILHKIVQFYWLAVFRLYAGRWNFLLPTLITHVGIYWLGCADYGGVYETRIKKNNWIGTMTTVAETLCTVVCTVEYQWPIKGGILGTW